MSPPREPPFHPGFDRNEAPPAIVRPGAKAARA